MFHAVRKWWSDGRAERTLGLFAFEFLVVVAGVFVAQWLQQHQKTVDARSQARVALEQNKFLYQYYAGLGEYWGKNGECIADRAMAIGRVSAVGGTMSAASIGRPAFPRNSRVRWTEDIRQAAREIVGNDKVEAMIGLEDYYSFYDRLAEQIAEDWTVFQMLDPANGALSAIDRAHVRQAAFRVAGNVRLLTYKARETRRFIAYTGWQPHDLRKQLEDANTIDGCGLLKKWR